jgi:hypothetical protein
VKNEMRDILLRAWSGFLASVGGATTAAVNVDWTSMLQAFGSLFATLVAIIAGVYSIRVSRKALGEDEPGD